MGRAWLHRMKVIPSTYHQMVSYPTEDGQINLLSKNDPMRLIHSNQCVSHMTHIKSPIVAHFSRQMNWNCSKACFNGTKTSSLGLILTCRESIHLWPLIGSTSYLAHVPSNRRILSDRHSTFSGYLTSGILSARCSTFSGYLTYRILSSRRSTFSGCLASGILSGRRSTFSRYLTSGILSGRRSTFSEYFTSEILSGQRSTFSGYFTSGILSDRRSIFSGYFTSGADAGWERRAIQLPRSDMSGSSDSAYPESIRSRQFRFPEQLGCLATHHTPSNVSMINHLIATFPPI
uniref:Uncharacterized protein n=1 Tax=Vitis vinifera TaxID=29760 RepID=A5BV37_VITVI|nr:hypothetical protein VITISV_017491 [Vitis vinifera]